MPKGNRTGPTGTGARSGRGAGFCAGFDMPGYANPMMAAGAGAGMRRRQEGWGGPLAGGRGWRHRSFATGRPDHLYFDSHPAAARSYNPEWEMESLRNRSRMLQAELDTISKRLEELDSQEKAP